MGTRAVGSDVPPAADLREHGRRLLDVLSLADAIPVRPRSPVLRAPGSSRGDDPHAGRSDHGHRRRLVRRPHAFGGALALAYYAEPRATVDIDLNVFVGAERFSVVATPLVELGVAADDPEVEALVRHDGQARVMWDSTPIDLFFSYDAFHDAAREARRQVPFGEGTIPILSASTSSSAR